MLSGFELYPRWVPLTGKNTTRGITSYVKEIIKVHILYSTFLPSFLICHDMLDGKQRSGTLIKNNTRLLNVDSR